MNNSPRACMKHNAKCSVRLVLAVAAFCLVGAAQAFAACTNPAGIAGQVGYNSDYATMQFCNGTSWVSMAASGALTELDPKVGTLAPSNICTSNAGGTAVVCTTPSVAVAQIGATGTPSATTYLRGDGAWSTPVGSSQWNNGTASAIYYGGGNVGIGTSSPQSALQVAGGVQIGNDAASCTTAKDGTL